MSKKRKTTKASFSFNGFGGVNSSGSFINKNLAKSIVNFRVRKDGALQKRPGFHMLTDIGMEVRAIHSRIENGKFVLYVLADDSVFLVNCKSGLKTYIGTILTNEGKSFFFEFQGELFLVDGIYCYVFQNDGFEIIHGYVPHLGKDWGVNVTGEINEPRNILCNKAKLTYLIPDPPSIYLCTQYEVVSVDAIFRNGMRVESSTYRIDNEFITINVQGLMVGDCVEICVTYRNRYGDLRDTLYNASASAIFGGSSNPRLVIGGNSGTLLCAKHVSDDALYDSKKLSPQSDDMYFPVGYELKIGSESNRVQAILRHHDNILIFTEGDVWVAAPDPDGKEEIYAISVNSEIGCAVQNGVTILKNDPVSIGYHDIWLWKDVTGSASRSEAVKLSDPISDELKKCDLRSCNLYYDKSGNELWLNDTASDTVWIYNAEGEVWYSYTGINADMIFEADGRTAFLSNNKIFVFDKEYLFDTDERNTPHQIVATYETHALDFGSGEYKNLSEIELSATTGDDMVTVDFEGDGYLKKTITIQGVGKSKELSVKKRVRSEKFKTAKFKLTAAGNEPQIIYDLKLSVR